jgi:hypothetical protein
MSICSLYLSILVEQLLRCFRVDLLVLTGWFTYSLISDLGFQTLYCSCKITYLDLRHLKAIWIALKCHSSSSQLRLERSPRSIQGDAVCCSLLSRLCSVLDHLRLWNWLNSRYVCSIVLNQPSLAEENIRKLLGVVPSQVGPRSPWHSAQSPDRGSFSSPSTWLVYKL